MKVFSDRGAHWYTTQGEGVIEIHSKSRCTQLFPKEVTVQICHNAGSHGLSHASHQGNFQNAYEQMVPLKSLDSFPAATAFVAILKACYNPLQRL